MVDVGLDDFLDSDDDEFFREASNHFLEYESTSESTQTKDTDVSSYHSPTVAASYFDLSASKANENEAVPESCKITLSTKNPTNSDVTDKNNISGCQVSSEACTDVASENIVAPKLITEKNEHFVCEKTPSLESEHCNKNAAIASTSSGSSASNTFSDSNKTSSSNISPFINSRFTPGFTPKAKRRKLPGPAGFFEFIEESKVAEVNDSNKALTLDLEFENVVSSQYTPEHLTLSSWQKLQAAVSSCSNLHSTAKYYSIQRVLSESSKKKLPKHMVVPVLCVLLKKLSNKGSTPILMDDTGEIHGKIDAEVLSLYKEFLVEGTALILKKVTFLCNVLILKVQNLVSMYHPNGTEKHLLSLESILETSEPLKPMNCECLKLSLVKNSLQKTPPSKISPINHTSTCIAHSQKKLKSTSTTFKTPHNIITNREKSNHLNDVKNSSRNYSRNASSSHSEQSSSNSELSSHGKSMRSNAFLENLLDEVDGMDDFDELLGNMDENSFMEDL